MLNIVSFSFREINSQGGENQDTLVCDVYYQDELLWQRVVIGTKFWSDLKALCKEFDITHMFGKMDLATLKILLSSNADY
ncbi:hypothetical protein WKH01_12390 [Pantoea agglomerans]|jgi:hypothetical protein|uniref:hypothetical protein n=1 Tax=Enterobacter agglomerans TaxID=549 RepID=UPI003C7D9855